MSDVQCSYFYLHDTELYEYIINQNLLSGTLVILVGLLVKVKSDVRISVIVGCSLISLESIAILALTSRVAKLRKKGPEIPKGPQFHDGEDIELNTISAKVDEENEDIGNHILSTNDLQPKDNSRRKSGASIIINVKELMCYTGMRRKSF